MRSERQENRISKQKHQADCSMKTWDAKTPSRLLDVFMGRARKMSKGPNNMLNPVN
jgi:hypothetical protein